MSIITSTGQLKKYVSIAESFHIEDFQPYENKAINTFIKKYVGDPTETITGLEDSDNEAINEATSHLESAVANLGMFLFLPYLSVILDGSGISIVKNDQRSTAEWWQIKDIRRDLLRSGLESLDLLLEVLESELELFEDYKNKYSSVNNELLVATPKAFSKYYNINNSRQTYLALQPTIRSVEDQYLHTMLCPELITALKENPTDETAAEIKDLIALKTLLEKAVVAFTVSKIASIGVFSLESTGLRINYETFIDGRSEAISYGKPSIQIQNLENELLTNASNYLQLAKAYIEDNSESFTQCEFPLLKSKAEGGGYKSYNTRGVFGL